MVSQKTFGIQEYRSNTFRRTTVQAIREAPLRILLNGREVITLLCTGLHPEFLAAGYLFSCGLIGSSDDIKQMSLTENETEIEVRVELKRGRGRHPGRYRHLRARTHRTHGQGKPLRCSQPPDKPWLGPQDVIRMAQELHAQV